MNHQIRWMLATAAVLGGGMLARPILTPRAAHAQAQPAQAGQAGRYQLTVHDASLYFVDTATGRVWSASAALNRKWLPIDSPVAPAK